MDKQVSDDLRRKLLSTLPTCAADFLRRQLCYALVNHDTALKWDGLVSYLECERFESDAEDARDSLYARSSAGRDSRSAAVRQPRRASRARTESLRPRPAFSSTADASDSDSDCSHRSVSATRGVLESRGAPAGQRRAPGTVPPRSPARGRVTVSLRCAFCRRLGHTESECRRANGLCFACGASDHFARDCTVPRDAGAVSSTPDHRRRPASPRPSGGRRHDSPGRAVAHGEHGDSRLPRGEGCTPAHMRPEN